MSLRSYVRRREWAASSRVDAANTTLIKRPDFCHIFVNRACDLG